MTSVMANTLETGDMALATMRIAVVMTCFNRREKTVACLERLFHQTGAEHLQVSVFLLDDGSNDGTSQAVLERWPEVRLLHGDGSLFWNRGMHQAFAAAMHVGFDAYVWLNDDTMLLPDALRRMVDTWAELEAKGMRGIVAGSTYDAVSGKWSYGGFRWKHGWRPALVPVEPGMNAAVPCDTMNGNCTLIPREVALMLGNLEPAFHHSFGDFDYGLRAHGMGVGVYIAPGYVGSCSDNPVVGTWRDGGSSFIRRWKHLRSPKGSPISQWALYCRRHLGYLWPLYAISPYAKTLASLVLPRQQEVGR